MFVFDIMQAFDLRGAEVLHAFPGQLCSGGYLTLRASMLITPSRRCNNHIWLLVGYSDEQQAVESSSLATRKPPSP